MNLKDRYLNTRKLTESICSHLQTEDYVVQPVVDVSPPKWHLGHTTWFFETFILKPYFMGYQEYNSEFNYVFNSYYETVGNRVIRTDRGNLSRPTVADIYRYREYVDEAMLNFLCEEPSADIKELLVLGFNHEEQHQELLLTDIKYILGHNPLFPAYNKNHPAHKIEETTTGFVTMPEGIYEIGFEGNGFCFDNELNRHKVYLNNYEISANLVSTAEYLEFIEADGYHDFRYWHAEGWDWVKNNKVEAPLYWHLIDGEWHHYTYAGLQPLKLNEPVCHISYFEACAYAAWKGMRLPTEFEWEAAADKFNWGSRWEWTESAYLPYPGFTKAAGAIGEYNGKFMVNQMVLRGASEVTSPGHSRKTYRNFFQTNLRWQFTGIRLAK
ncbi:ergothioneine biosynthesis protein EgtB [Mucilaginibacter auburnensis]|uniref:Ergothioneine biosynthesis protein EgtB n=1 Tax=Mucilaginibacter auburnensis TaxID=1457233 RepID=A0A2H9VQF5_9SPHI|nr:ergothioneine biosynthesis protein EgtB [Mucilaginibacter auburnensis]PJJ83049.1 ergothioneine biosynthesis protein EgtB [Mucilaginibacter auburnensis]